MFDLNLHNIPLVNLRLEFQRYIELFEKDEFRNWFRLPPKHAIALPGMIWRGSQDTLLTLLLQRSILGIEAYIPGAIFTEAGLRGCLEKGDCRFLSDPFVLRGRGTVDNYYHRLPSKLCRRFSLKVCNAGLWEKTKQFYKEIRNPLFHGKEVEAKSVDSVHRCFLLIQDLYGWIDSWDHPNKQWLGLENILKRGNVLEEGFSLLKIVVPKVGIISIKEEIPTREKNVPTEQ
jgi:hypothetical protein